MLSSLACAFALAAPSLADTRVFRDPDEKPFCESPGPCPDRDGFDFRRLSQGHGTDHRIVRHGIRNAKRWPTKWLGGRYGITIYIDFNVDDGGFHERQIRVRRKHGELWAAMFAGRWKDKRVEGKVHVWRPTHYSVKIGFPVDMLKGGITRYRWTAWYSERNLTCPGSCNNDNSESFLHRL